MVKKNVLTPGKEARFRRLGKALGFPSCCVDYFIENYEHETLRKGQYRFSLVGGGFLGSGYIPCKSCSDTKSFGEIVAYIDEHRSERYLPFPIGKTEKQYIHGIRILDLETNRYISDEILIAAARTDIKLHRVEYLKLNSMMWRYMMNSHIYTELG